MAFVTGARLDPELRNGRQPAQRQGCQGARDWLCRLSWGESSSPGPHSGYLLMRCFCPESRMRDMNWKGSLSRTLVMLRPPVQECFHHHFLFRFSKPQLFLTPMSNTHTNTHLCFHSHILIFKHSPCLHTASHRYTHTHRELHKYSLTHTTDLVNSAPRFRSPAFEKPMRTVCVDAGRAQGTALCSHITVFSQLHSSE